MKKLWTLPVLLAIVCLCFVGCAPKAKGSIDQADMNVYPVSTYDGSLSVAMGDVMPFYDNGVMNIYHLQNSRGSLSMYYHPIARVTTTDFTHYNDEGVAINFEEDYNSPDAALGTGSFIKDSDGNYHCFYTGHNTLEDTGLPYHEVVRHAVSTDGQKTWQKVEEFNLYGNNHDFRDPYVYYDSFDECYYMLVATKDGGANVIRQYAATSLNATSDEWRDCGNFFVDDGVGFMECPSYLEFNGYYYLAFSEQNGNRVTHYRYQTERNGAWQRFENDIIDGTGFYAGRIEKAENALYAFAWCAKLSGGSAGDFDWGGNLVAHELKQRSNGELAAVMVSSVKDALSNQVEYKSGNGDKLDSFSFDGKGFSSYSVEALSTNVTRLHFEFTLNSFVGDFGLTFGLDGAYNNRLGKGLVAFDASNSSVVCYNDVASIIRYGTPLSSVSFVYAIGKTYEVDILIDGEILTVYLDEMVALTARIPNMNEKNFAFYSNGADLCVKEITFYE